MLHIQQFVKAKSVEEAYTLLTKNRNNVIIAGMMWLKMQDRHVPVAIDLSNLHLDMIEEDENGFLIGAMTSLRDLELHEGINSCFHNILKDALQDIVGVQFRNGATVGGSIYSRFGFSDVLTALLCLDCEVVLHKGGRIPLKTYAQMPYERDIITHIYIRKEVLEASFVCVRKSATDLSVLNVAIARLKDNYRIAVGATPKKAQCYIVDATLDKNSIAKNMAKEIVCGDNMRASKEYRSKLVEALIIRALTNIEEGTSCK